MLPAQIEKVVANTFIWVSPDFPLNTDTIASNAVSDKNPMKTFSSSLRISA
jgi:hypothetical protein